MPDPSSKASSAMAAATDAQVASFKRALAELLAEASERRAKLAGRGGKRGGQAA